MIEGSVPSRRQVLRAGGAGLLATMAADLLVPRRAAAQAGRTQPGQTEFDLLRERWTAILTGGQIDPNDRAFATALSTLDAKARGHLASLDTSSGRTALWPDLPVGQPAPSSNVTGNYARLRDIGLAYKTRGTSLFADAELAAELVHALDFLGTTSYRPGQVAYGNWWDWEIGSPQALEDVCVLLYEHLPAGLLATQLAAIDHFVPTPYLMMPARKVSTGANRVDLARIVALRGILGANAASIATARDCLSDVFPYVLTGDGLYEDGSFVQHDNVPYTGTYGHVFLNRLSLLFQLVSQSTWDITDPAKANIYKAAHAAFAPVVYSGIMLDSVRGRALSRANERDADDGMLVAWDFLLLADSAGQQQAPVLRAIAKGWLQRNTIRPITAYGSVAQIATALPILADRTVRAAPEPERHVQFPNMDRVVHQRRGWAYAIAMNSARMNRFESMNGENLRGWHTTDGMTYLYLDTDLGQYTAEFWPTVNPYRLPGITVSTKALPDGAGAASVPTTTWAGGAVLADEHGAVGMDLQPYQTTLRAKKSWLCLGDVVVALGAGITSTEPHAIETIVDNRNLGPAGDARLTVNGRTQPESLGRTRVMRGTRWVHVEGVGGLLFPDRDGVTLNALREDRTGRWRDISTTGSTDEITRRYLTLWLDHGVNPSNAQYAYVQLPGLSAAQTRIRDQIGGIRIVANTATVQAARDDANRVIAANFFGQGSAGGITADGPASVLVQDTPGGLRVAVSEPTRRSATRLIEIDRRGYRPTQASPGVTVLSSARKLRILVEAGGSHGATHTVSFTASHRPVTERHVALLPVRADTYVRDGAYADDNYGGAPTLVVKRTDTGSGYNRQALLRFDLTGVTGRVERAVLWVHGRVSDSGGTQTTLRAHRTTTPWDEGTVTWTTRPGLGPGAGSGAVSTATDWVGLEVTALVGRTPDLNLTLHQEHPGLAVVLGSKEGAGDAPMLQVVTTART